MSRSARAHYRLRRRREQVFGDMPGLFGEPAWDLLLDLFDRQQRGQATCISSACIASQAPATTALRYIERMLEAGLITRQPDPSDRRRAYIRLTPTGMEKMTTMFGDRP